MRFVRCALASLLVVVAAPVRAQMRACWASTSVELGTVDARAPEAVAAVDGSTGNVGHALVVVRRAPGALAVVPVTMPSNRGQSVGGPPITLTIEANEHLVDLWSVRDVYVLRTVGVCPNAGRLFHKCMHLRVLGVTGRQRGVTLDEDVVEWSGVGNAAVVGDQLVTLRTPMYDANGVPSVATYGLSASGDAIARIGSVTRLGTDARPDAHGVIAVLDGHWAALLVSNVGDAPPLVVTGDGQHAAPVPRLAPDLNPVRAALEPDGTVDVLFDGPLRVGTISPGGALTAPLKFVEPTVGVPPALSAVSPEIVLRTAHGHVLVADADVPPSERPLATLAGSAAHAPLLAGVVGPRFVAILFSRAGRTASAQAIPLTCGAVYQH